MRPSGLCGVVVAAALLGVASVGRAGDDGFLDRCDDGEWRGWKESLVGDHPAAINLYNAAFWTAGAGAIRLGVDVPRGGRWTARNSFDDEIRGALRSGSLAGQDSVGLASDALLAASITLPLAGVGRTWYGGRCDRAFDMASEWLESILLAAFVSEVTKVVAARERPFRVNCPDCGGSAARRSFISGHAALAAAGAGVTCSHSILRQTWGSDLHQRALPCAFGVGAAVATGLLRIGADDHWATDVLVGWTLGGIVGFFDAPGPFDLLRFRVRGKDGQTAAEGIGLPSIGRDRFGAQVHIRF